MRYMRHLLDKFGDPTADPYTDPWLEAWIAADPDPDDDQVESIRDRRRLQARAQYPEHRLVDVVAEISARRSVLELYEAQRDALVAELLSQGRSVRDVATLAGLSHMAVSRRRIP